MLSVMLSEKQFWSGKILSGEKKADIRKSIPTGAPGCTCPFRVYLYETKAKKGAGAVVGECICFCADEIQDYSIVTDFSCLTEWQLAKYARGRKIYAWFLGEIVKYDKPKPLSEFGLARAPQSWCYVERAV